MVPVNFAPASDAIWPGFVDRRAKPLRLVLIDDHSIVREGLRALLSLESDLCIVGDAGDLANGIELVRRLKPDLTICDLTMPGCAGATAVRALYGECPATPVLVLTAQDSLEFVREAFGAGAIGYVRKDAVRADLLATIRHAAAGTQAICRGVADRVTRTWLHPDGAQQHRMVDANLGLEDREIIRRIALGVPTWRIAAEMGKGVKSLEKYRANLMRRLHLDSAAAVTRYAILYNILPGQDVGRASTD